MTSQVIVRGCSALCKGSPRPPPLPPCPTGRSRSPGTSSGQLASGRCSRAVPKDLDFWVRARRRGGLAMLGLSRRALLRAAALRLLLLVRLLSRAPLPYAHILNIFNLTMVHTGSPAASPRSQSSRSSKQQRAAARAANPRCVFLECA